ncbi:MAG TPA: hypothetical protein VMY59_01055 [Candidatus Thermoplasmatota archaeon]|nr:hypothetical protein [Candidatus Thermoplasmatota archaeon]
MEKEQSRFEVDKEKYRYLDPLWKVLESVPSDIKITMEKAGEQSGLDPGISVPLIQDFCTEYQKNIMKHFTRLILHGHEMTDTWAFDKIMLLTNRIDTGTNMEDDIDPKLMRLGERQMKKWNDKWREKRGV